MTGGDTRPTARFRERPLAREADIPRPGHVAIDSPNRCLRQQRNAANTPLCQEPCGSDLFRGRRPDRRVAQGANPQSQ